MADSIGVGMLGYAFMGQAHSLALRAVLAVAHPLPVIPELVSICGRDPAALERARARFGWAEAVTDWREQVADERVGLFVDAGPNAVHAEPVIAAARNGKHVFCEKPLGRNAAEAHRMWSAAHAAGVVHMTAFNYRFFPALRLARQMIAAGDLGTIHHFRSVFLDASAVDPDQRKTVWRFRADAAGSGALGDLGAHHIDVARYLVGEPRSVSATVRTFVGERSGSTVDVEFPPGHPLSWADSFTHEYAHLLGSIDGGHDVAPLGATFEDGYRCAEVCDAILDAARTGRRTAIVYRPVGAAP
jgi:predicted dehydrogenase